MISNTEKNVSLFLLIILSVYFLTQTLIAALFSIIGTDLIDVSDSFFISVFFYYLISLIGCIVAFKGIKKDSMLMVIPGIIIGIIPILNCLHGLIKGYSYFQNLIISLLFVIPIITMFKIVRGR